ncbi:glycosyltransferase [Fusobacterium sp.]|uniref:glycosyltransferase n=1 Tax=Fusobacterium sp. TaxID=68766 RepID=UPI002903CD25|nr:glycosyltransferase [Fusobacterium sp.]MDU1912161.1 glycosyltransferase [Fusobacterium sp.]
MLAPVLVSVYNRRKSFLECIEYLKRNSLASKTILYVVSDAAYRKEDKEIIELIRKDIEKIKGFQKVVALNREENLGAYVSINSAIEEIINQHGKIIFLEDDIRVSPFFLKYMNNSLEKYENDKKIFSISGYNFPLNDIEEELKEDIFLWERYCPWGVGTWKNRWEKIDWDLKKYKEIFSDKENVKKFNKIEPNCITMLEKDREGVVKATDARVCFHTFINNMYTIYPRKTLTVNRGHDGSGEHCGVDKKYFLQQLDEDFDPVLTNDLKENKEVYRKMYEFHYSFLRQIIKPILKKLKLFDLINNFRYFVMRKIK